MTVHVVKSPQNRSFFKTQLLSPLLLKYFMKVKTQKDR